MQEREKRGSSHSASGELQIKRKSSRIKARPILGTTPPETSHGLAVSPPARRPEIEPK